MSNSHTGKSSDEKNYDTKIGIFSDKCRLHCCCLCEVFAFSGNNGLICSCMRVSATYPMTWTLSEFSQGGGITYCNSANYILMIGHSAVVGCLFAYRPGNSPAGGVRATATSSGHRVRRCGHFGLTCRRTPAYNALCGTLTPQVIFTKPESFAVAMLPPWASVCPLIRTLAPALNRGRGPQAERSGRVSEEKSD